MRTNCGIAATLTQKTMAGSEAAPLILKRASLPSAATEDKVGCCCVESSRLAKVPVIRTLCRKRRPEEKVHGCLAPQKLHIKIVDHACSC